MTEKEHEDLLARLEKAEAELRLLTTPRPISDLHEDDGEVLLVHWGETGGIEYWSKGQLLQSDFDPEEWTHFYPAPRFLPPADGGPTISAYVENGKWLLNLAGEKHMARVEQNEDGTISVGIAKSAAEQSVEPPAGGAV